MTIYAQHANRGKVQILATYRRQASVVSTTVTSVDSAAIAEPIVDALNRVSACATVPVSVRDTRDDRYDLYPADHLAALVDRDARATLLVGAHSLWYEQAMWLLHEALVDLDDAVAVTPEPVRRAINVELEIEARALRDALAEYTEGIAIPDPDNHRSWDADEPFVLFEGGMPALCSYQRRRLNRLERGASEEQLRQGVEDLRLLLEASAKSTNLEASLFVDELSITAEPWSSSRYFVDVDAPLPSGDHGRTEWTIDLSRWDIDLDDPANEGETAKGELVLRCVRASAPTITEIVDLLDRTCTSQQLLEWATTPIGDTLAGTTYVVTERYDEEATPSA